MSRTGTYDLKYGFIPDDDCPHGTPRKTNADRIRSMTDEELARRWLAVIMPFPNEWLDWLKQEADE